MALSQLIVLLSYFKTKAFELKIIIFRFVTALINTHHYRSIEKEGLRPRPHKDDCKRKLFYAFRSSVHTKTMKTLTVNA